MWERRYGYPVPTRSPSGHRRFNAEHVEALTRIARLVKEGRAVGDLIGAHLAGALQPAEAATRATGAAAQSVATLVDLLTGGDPWAAEAEFAAISEARDVAAMVCEVCEPALIEVGERWFRGDCEIYQEHCATGFLMRKLAGLLERAQRANLQPLRRVLLGTVQGDRHDGGVMMLAVLLEMAGWRTLCVGVDLPVREYRKAVEGWKPDALALSFVMSRNINKRFQELREVRGVPIFVGGRGILNYQGLARRYGLIPLPGSAASGLAQLLGKFEEWKAAPPDSRET